MPLSYAYCRRLCREAERCEPILHAMEAYEEAYGQAPPVRRALFMDGSQPACFARKSREKPHMAAGTKPG
jgi:hypothetical protein